MSKSEPKELYLELQDAQWPLDYIDHHRRIARAIVVDDQGGYYFVRLSRRDEFGSATFLETSGGGVEDGEELHTAIARELREELGVTVEILCKLGVVSDYYNLIHRHNINHYFLCRVTSFADKQLTQDEAEKYHLTTVKLTYEEAVQEYKDRAQYKLGSLISARELPILHHAKEILDQLT